MCTLNMRDSITMKPMLHVRESFNEEQVTSYLRGEEHNDWLRGGHVAETEDPDWLKEGHVNGTENPDWWMRTSCRH